MFNFYVQPKYKINFNARKNYKKVKLNRNRLRYKMRT